MNTLRQRGLVALAVLTLGVFACSERPRDAADTVADTMTTPTMRRELSRDLAAAEVALQQLEDSVDAALGPELIVRLQPMRDAFVAYRKAQCERLKGVFEDGTYGAVAELQCLIHLTDDKREFVEEHYHFVEKLEKGRRGKMRASAGHGAALTP
jgi:hypothetical protein